MSTPSAEPGLYEVDGGGVPTLLGMRDSSGFVSYPFQEHGSERTGDHGAQLARIALAGTGTVTALVDVHVPVAPAVGTPYRLASVVLDEGPMVRSVLVDAEQVRSGSRVRAVTVPIVRGDRQVAELRFAPLPTGEDA